MATYTKVMLVDDLDGSAAEEQIEFAVDGCSYQIDLSAVNVARFREALAPFISAARRSTGRHRSTPTSARPVADRKRNQAIRKWAQRQGGLFTQARGPAEMMARPAC
ncbi:histone-like nucleoid-structuring protein Lsr2 [Pseudonocardia asaccharolytica]|uniref:histone-like nucleoid-structuring protein Lsr2 n=1 Tax=Pseudonocardia asaccharolytica TaxID=54010 RepID=UPI0011BD5380|nr:Lsr2 family protein [Pseudonocardia asaccharolytica]